MQILRIVPYNTTAPTPKRRLVCQRDGRSRMTFSLTNTEYQRRSIRGTIELGEIQAADITARKSLIREVVKYLQAGGQRFFQKDATGKYQEITNEAATQITLASCLMTKDAKAETSCTTGREGDILLCKLRGIE